MELGMLWLRSLYKACETGGIWCFDESFLDFRGEMLKYSNDFPSVIIKVFLNFLLIIRILLDFYWIKSNGSYKTRSNLKSFEEHFGGAITVF